MSNLSPVSSPVKRARLTQSHPSPGSQITGAARDLLSGALHDAIRSRDEKKEEPEVSPSPTKINGSPTKSTNKGIRRKRRKEPEENTDFHHTFVMKLFDRSTDLAQFPTNTPLYPVCRAWMRNEPSNVNQGPRERTPTPPPPPGSSTEESPDVYSLPPPDPPQSTTGDRCPRIPPVGPPPVLEGVDIELYCLGVPGYLR
ncbi:protein lin-37 homolog isoform X2 [Eurytemora carolleeae]|uniref:protein lin-37 homolog isoform X2 n=1 Tax=Eurytemora carolleeae TaxID=1294199 RepID=UPI000C78CC5D|nr:protein lin-37 homolog isoform X2 [Eurytemora carolleeae]|eukprot:XP_023333684.1 protein lin-37 homolog isoform X2 [Eurytemora affinis]